MERTVSILIRVPSALKEQIELRADRERRSTNAEITAMLEWAIANMPEQLRSPLKRCAEDRADYQP